MSSQKGFALIEVLVSMILLSAVALFLLQQQALQRQLFNELRWVAGASQFLNQIEELRRIDCLQHIEPEPPYQLKISPHALGLYWQNYSLIRVS